MNSNYAESHYWITFLCMITSTHELKSLRNTNKVKWHAAVVHDSLASPEPIEFEQIPYSRGVIENEWGKFTWEEAMPPLE